MPKVVCCSLNAERGPHLKAFEAGGFDLAIPPKDANLMDEDVLIDVLQGAGAAIAGSEPYSRKVIEACPELRVIARSGVGFDAVDLEACDERGVVLTTTPGVNHHSVAEHTFALLLGVARGFADLDRRVRENRWQRMGRPRVIGSTLGIVGLGRIGRAVATRGVGLGMKVIAMDPYPNEEFCDQWSIDVVGLEELLANSDYVSLHAPMLPENHHLMNAQRLALMKPGSVLINTARGPIIDEAALYDALKSGHLRGAGLDVFEEEPLPLESPLLEFDNVLFSGHVAGLDIESHDDTFALLAQTTIALYNGEWPAFCIQNLKGVTDWSWSR